MAGPLDINASLSASSSVSSGAQSGETISTGTGDFLVGSNKTPAWVWIVLGIVGVILAVKFLFPSKRKGRR